MADATPSRSHWYVLATVGLMLLVPCCWLLIKWHEVRAEREAGAAITKAGGSVEYGEPRGPQWLRDRLGDQWFQHIVRVSFGSSATDHDLDRLTGLIQLRNLLLECCTRITDAGLVRLKGLTQLQELALDHTRITDAGLEHVKGLARLQWLSLNSTGITDAGLRHLRSLTQLQVLSLEDTRITDAGLEHLTSLTQLRMLLLGDTKITDAGLEHLKGLPHLDIVWLSRTRVTDTGVKKLRAALPNGCRQSQGTLALTLRPIILTKRLTINAKTF